MLLNRRIKSKTVSMVCALLVSGAQAQESATNPQQIVPAEAAATPTPAETAPAVEPAANQTVEPAAKPTVEPVAKQTVEKIEVTGSHIRRTDTEGVSPVQTLTRKDLEKTGYNSVGDVLRDLSANTFGSTRESSGDNASGNAEISLRGLGSDKTLVLLDGQRLPPDAVTGATDLNLIPMAAVERVEVLKDGASAIYGSDALGGVVNIITRKDFAGSEVAMSFDDPQAKGGQKKEVSAVNGISGEGWNVVNVVQYRKNDVIYSRDRGWTATQMSLIGNPGSYQDTTGKWRPDPNCPANLLYSNGEGTFCRYNTADQSTQLPGIEQFGFLSQANVEVTSDLKLYARLGGTDRVTKWAFAPSPGNFTIPGANDGNLAPGGGLLPGTQAGTDVPVRIRTVELGNRDQVDTSKSLNALVGANYQLPKGWQLDVSTSDNMVWGNFRGVSGYALLDTLTNDVTSGQYKPFAAGNKGDISNARYTPVENTLAKMFTTEIKATTELAQLPGGGLGIAIGALYADQKFEDDYDSQSLNGNVFGASGAQSNNLGTRHINAAYTELSLPLSKALEIQAAGRYDSYSDFGSTFNPKLGFLLHASEKVLIRGSWGTGFKAPNMQDLYSGANSGYPTFIDRKLCAHATVPSDCLPQQWQVTTTGNRNLGAEKAQTYNLGVIVEPTHDFNIGLDGFYTKLNNVVGINYEQLTLAEQNGVNLAQYGITVTRDSNGYIQNIQTPILNLSKQEVSGLDITSAYSAGRWKFLTDHSIMFFYKMEGFPGTSYINYLQTNGQPQWRNMTSATYLLAERADLTLTAITIAGQQKANPDAGKLPNYTSLDLMYTQALEEKKGDKKSIKQSVSLGIKNLLGSTPPLDDSNPNQPLNPTLYDQIGRQYFASYKVDF